MADYIGFTERGTISVRRVRGQVQYSLSMQRDSQFIEVSQVTAFFPLTQPLTSVSGSEDTDFFYATRTNGSAFVVGLTFLQGFQRETRDYLSVARLLLEGDRVGDAVRLLPAHSKGEDALFTYVNPTAIVSARPYTRTVFESEDSYFWIFLNNGSKYVVNGGDFENLGLNILNRGR